MYNIQSHEDFLSKNHKLAHLYEKARIAHAWTSFMPERRARSIIAEFSMMLDEDVAAIEKAGLHTDSIGWYKAKYESLFVAWLNRKSNCFSSVITGGSKFPVAKAEKANKREHESGRLFYEWRERWLKKLTKGQFRPKGLDEELDAARRNLNKREANQLMYKEVNKICRQKKKSDVEIFDELKEKYGFKDSAINGLLNPPYSYQKRGFDDYVSTNNGAMIRTLSKRVEMLEEKILLRETTGNEDIEFEGGVLTINREIDRVQIAHEQKPAADIIQRLKGSGFNWSPNYGVWQRKITNAAIFEAKRIVGLPL